MNPEKKAQCTVVVTRDDTALNVAIKAAEEKIREENFENKYTEVSKTALRKFGECETCEREREPFCGRCEISC